MNSSHRFLTTANRITNYAPHISELSSRRQPSAIRKLIPLASQEGMVSLGGGLPNPSLFPFSSFDFKVRHPITLQEELLSMSSQDLHEALQYSPTPGLIGLTKELKKLQRHCHGVDDNVEVSVMVGSQDGLCKAFELLLNPQTDVVFLENPTYSGALSFLHPFGVELVPVATNENGMLPEALQEALARHPKARRRVLYTIPTAQNPSGSTMPNDRRREIYKLAQENDVMILEDDPYYFLHPNRQELVSFLEMDTQGRVLRFDSFSKLLSSGIRIGFVSGPPALLERINLHTQSTNLHASGLSQAVVLKALQSWGLEGLEVHATRVAEFYLERRDVLIQSANRHLDGLAEWNAPDAGMFLWIKLLQHRDTKSLIEERAAQAKVLFVPGQAFCPLNEPSSYVRASFSTASDEEMEIAMQRFSTLLRQDTMNM